MRWLIYVKFLLAVCFTIGLWFEFDFYLMQSGYVPAAIILFILQLGFIALAILTAFLHVERHYYAAYFFNGLIYYSIFSFFSFFFLFSRIALYSIEYKVLLVDQFLNICLLVLFLVDFFPKRKKKLTQRSVHSL